MSNWSIRRRLLVASTVFMMICVAFFQLVWVPRVTGILVEAETRETHRQVDILIDGLMPFILSNQNAAIYETLDSIAERHDNWESILLTRADNRQIYPLQKVDEVDGPSIVDVSREIRLRGKPWGRLEARVDLAEEIEILHSELHRLVLAAVLSLLFLITAIGLFLDRIIIRRLAKLAAAADQLGSGAFDAELPAPTHDEVGRLSESFGVMRQQILENVSSLEDARKQAENALEAKSRFLATMSHELRTPLNGIIPATEILRKSPLNVDQMKMVETIKLSSRSLLSIIDDILDLARIEEGRLEPRKVLFNAGELVAGVADMLRASANEKALQLKCEVDPLANDYFGDEDRIRQILVNLVGNAIKFTETGSVKIRCRPVLRTKGLSQVLFEVEDTGIGIKEEDTDRVFERFEQAEGGLTRRFGGSGLGLAITKKLVSALEGEVGMRSQYGKGSTFFFLVPLDNCAGPVVDGEPSDTKERRVTNRPDPASTVPLDILLADDNAINLEVTTAILQSLGHRVRTAQNGQEAMEAVASSDFDLVLMDIHMPKMDGLEATRKIRTLPSHRSATTIIALTASIMEEDVQRCLAAGINDILTKPVTFETVIRSIEKVPARMTSVT